MRLNFQGRVHPSLERRDKVVGGGGGDYGGGDGGGDGGGGGGGGGAHVDVMVIYRSGNVCLSVCLPVCLPVLLSVCFHSLSLI